MKVWIKALVLVLALAACDKEVKRNELRINRIEEESSSRKAEEAPRIVNIRLSDNEEAVYIVYALANGERKMVARGSSNQGNFYKKIELEDKYFEIEIVRSSSSGWDKESFALESDSTNISSF